VKLEALAKSAKVKFTQNIVANMGITIEHTVSLCTVSLGTRHPNKRGRGSLVQLLHSKFAVGGISEA